MPGVGRCWLACFGGDVPWYLLEIVDGFELNKFLRRSWGGLVRLLCVLVCGKLAGDAGVDDALLVEFSQFEIC